MNQKISQFVVLAGFLFMSFGAFSDTDSFREKRHQAGVTAEELQAYLEHRKANSAINLQAFCAFVEEAPEVLSAEDLLVYLALQGKSISALNAVAFIKALELLRDNVILRELLCEKSK